MSPTKARIAAAVAVVRGFLVGATFLLLHMGASHAASAGHHHEPPFKFSHHTRAMHPKMSETTRKEVLARMKQRYRNAGLVQERGQTITRFFF